MKTKRKPMKLWKIPGDSRQALTKSIANSRRAAFAATGGNGSGNNNNNNNVNKEARASTLPRVRQSPSPRVSSPSLADSAVGSSAEVASFNAEDQAFSPGSDGSDSFVTSSAVGSPEPVDQVKQKSSSGEDVPDRKIDGTEERIHIEVAKGLF